MIYLSHNDEHVKSTSKIYEVNTNICSKCRKKINNDSVPSKISDISDNEIAIDSQDVKAQEIITSIERNETNRIGNHNISSKVIEESKNWLPSKSENDLTKSRKETKAVKERSKFTTSTFTRCNTFVGGNNEQCKFKKRTISIPNHIPVRTYVNNIECNKNKSI